MSEVAQELIDLARTGEGGTVALNGRPLPTGGYYVGGAIQSLIIPVGQVGYTSTLIRVIEFVARADTPYVGCWRDDDLIYFDAVDWYAEEHTAGAIGRVRREIAIWDVARSRELRLAGE